MPAMEDPPTPRQRKRFSPQPVQSGFRSNRPPSEPEQAIVPAPSSTINVSSSGPIVSPSDPESSLADGARPVSQSLTTKSLLGEDVLPSPPKPRRRFAPQPVEKAKRQKRSDSIGRIMLPEDRTDVSTEDGKTVHHNNHHVSRLIFEKRKAQRRGHSYTIPTLQAITSFSGSESDDSPNSSPPSLSHSPTNNSDDTVHTASSVPRPPRHQRPDKPPLTSPETTHDSFEGYLLALAAASAQREIGHGDGMDAAYVNSEFHEPVQHYAIDDDDDDQETLVPLRPSGSATTRKSSRRKVESNPFSEREDSFAEAAREMQQHLPELQEPDDGEDEADKYRKPDGMRQEAGPFGGASFGRDLKAALGGSAHVRSRREDLELEAMRAAAKAPLAGADLEFVRCRSPEPARLVVEHDARTLQGTQNRAVGGGGLWGGYCVDRSACGSPAGKAEPGQALDCAQVAALAQRKTQEQKQRLSESEIEAEFGDQFCTQVYNYLSLGYPCMARPYDEELSNVAGVEIQTLRVGDWDPDTDTFDPTARKRKGVGMRRYRMRGFVGLPEGHSAEYAGEGGTRRTSRAAADIWAQIEEDEAEEDETEVDGMVEEEEGEEEDPRWLALRKYIRWWAGQLGRSEGEEGHSFGVGRSPEKVGRTVGGDRRGSWGQ